jgi:peroxiredoxin
VNGYWIFAFASLWVLLVVIAIAQLGLLRRVAPLLEQHGHRPMAIGGLTDGARPPAFSLVDGAGNAVESDALLGRGPVLVLLSDAGCAPCEQLAAELRERGTAPLGTELVVISRQPVGHLRLPAEVIALQQHGNAAAEAFQTFATPHAFAVDADGVVRGSTVPARVDDLVRLAGLLDARPVAGS